jgi:Phasin protein
MHSHNGFKSEIFSADTDPTLQFFAAFDMMDHSDLFAAPFKAMAISQLEWMGFLSRRTRAVMHFPSDMARCRTPQDIAALQQAAMQSAYEDWTLCSQKITTAWAHVVEQAAASSAPEKQKTKRRPQRRDYMVLPAEAETEPSAQPDSGARNEAA